MTGGVVAALLIGRTGFPWLGKGSETFGALLVSDCAIEGGGCMLERSNLIVRTLAALASAVLFVWLLGWLISILPNSWTYGHECNEKGRELTDAEFIESVLGLESLQNNFFVMEDGSLDPHYVKMDPGKFIKVFPNCCSIYLGDPKDYFAPPSDWEIATRKIARIVKITYPPSGRNRYREASFYFRLDSCGKLIEDR
jgi:hypothetical protein